MFKPYFKSLISEIALYANELRGRKIDSIFIGGGTPSHVNYEYIGSILDCFKFEKDCEITIEVNPGAIAFHNFMQYKKMGINRISFGIQSFSDRVLIESLTTKYKESTSIPFKLHTTFVPCGTCKSPIFW